MASSDMLMVEDGFLVAGADIQQRQVKVRYATIFPENLAVSIIVTASSRLLGKGLSKNARKQREYRRLLKRSDTSEDLHVDQLIMALGLSLMGMNRSGNERHLMNAPWGGS
mmetsp:Transcript_42188/g.74010  ORF Transcript_42188/g.74010 Transcript_42188/m.74010 type:complete len:111 (-) Transcript_42188:28-360(-)